MKSCVSPTGPDHSKNRETVFSDHCHQTGQVSGGRRDSNVCQTSKCPECGTHLPVGSRLTPFAGLKKPLGGGGGGGAGLHSPFPVKTKLDEITQIINCYAHLHKNLLVRSIISAYGQGMVQTSQFQNLWAPQPCLVPNHTTFGDLF